MGGGGGRGGNLPWDTAETEQVVMGGRGLTQSGTLSASEGSNRRRCSGRLRRKHPTVSAELAHGVATAEGERTPAEG